MAFVISAQPPESDLSGPRSDQLLRITDWALRGLLLYSALMVWVGVCMLVVRMLAPERDALGWAVGALMAAMASAGVWHLREPVADRVRQVARAAAVIDERRWLITCLALGLLLRVICSIMVRTGPVSDGGTYLQLAHGLLDTGSYAIGGSRAYWPPGYPMFLLPWLSAFGNDRAAIVASNFFLYFVGFFGVRALAQRLGGPVVLRLALALYCVWPNLVLLVPMPEKEQVLLAVLPWVLVLWSDAIKPARSPLSALLAGVLLGGSMLVQPALQVLFPVLVLMGLLESRRPRRLLLCTCLALVGVAVIVGPWTWRNYQVFDRWVLVSTNGGPGLFGANNPKATGGYLPLDQWPADLRAMSELESDREGKRRALEWIAANPVRVAQLAIEKNARFMGDDAVGAYQGLNRGPGAPGGWVYALVKALSNAFWLGYWSLAMSALFVIHRERGRLCASQLLPVAVFLHSFALHSLAESAGKYHVLWTAVLCVMLPILLRVDAAGDLSRPARPFAAGALK